MGFFQKIFSKKELTPVKKTFFSNGLWKPLLSDDSDSDYFSSWVYSCVVARAENLAKAEIFLYSKRSSVIKEITDHPFIDLMNQTNLRDQTMYELLFLISINLDLYGNCYVWNLRNKINKPDSFYILPTHNVKPKFDDNGSQIIGYEYWLPSGSRFFSIDEIIHFKLPSPKSQFLGLPTINSCKFAIDIDNLQQLYQKRFYENDASVGAVLSTDQQLTDETYDRLITSWYDRFKGADNANKLAVLENGLNYQPLKGTPREVDYNKSRIDIRNEIIAKMRVPPAIFGITENSNRANSEAAMVNFIDNTIKPFSRFITDKFNIFLKKNYDKSLFLTFEYPEFEDTNIKINLYKMLLDKEVISKDEARQAFGFDNN